jgi:hypothetical protein
MPPQGPYQNQPPQVPPQPQQPYPQPQYPQQQFQQPYQQPPAPKKMSPWVWVAIAFGVLVVMGVAAIGVGSYLLYRTVKNAGFDAQLMKSNPGLAMAKMATALNPDYETVSTNDGAGTITVREKSTGKTMQMRFDPDKKSLVIVGDDGKEVKLSASIDDKNGGVAIQSSEGSLKIGAAAGASPPAWVPVYPGASTQGAFFSDSKDGSQNTFTFKTKESAGKVLTYYQEQLKAAGFTVNVVTATDQGGLVQAEDSSKQRTVTVTAGSSGEGAEGSVTSTEKK